MNKLYQVRKNIIIGSLLMLILPLVTGCASGFSLQKIWGIKEVNLVDSSGKPHGYWIYYFDSEKQSVQFEGRYNKGVPVGKWVLYYPDGTKYVQTRYYKTRTRERRYDADGIIEKKGWSKLVLDDPEEIRYYWHGRWRVYGNDGKLQEVVLYRFGEPERVLRTK